MRSDFSLNSSEGLDAFRLHEEFFFVFAVYNPTPKRFDIFSPLTEGCSEGLDAFRFFFKHCGHPPA